MVMNEGSPMLSTPKSRRQARHSRSTASAAPIRPAPSQTASAPTALAPILLPNPYIIPVQIGDPGQINWKTVAAAAEPGALIPQVQMASAYRIGRYTPAERKVRLDRYRAKRAQRNYTRRVQYDCRKMIADKRHRVQGRFVKREEEVAIAARKALQDCHSHAAHDDGDGHGHIAGMDGSDVLQNGSDIAEYDETHSATTGDSETQNQALVQLQDFTDCPRLHDADHPTSPDSHFLAAADELPSLHDDDHHRICEGRSVTYV